MISEQFRDGLREFIAEVTAILDDPATPLR
jgi:hypothetical protein